ncbi:MAG TPA: hypothetical protein VMO81_04690 [Aestuariivirgaceae bacterium]|nr:hypothetical protein [Aestuariivirgaceae bacterium]
MGSSSRFAAIANKAVSWGALNPAASSRRRIAWPIPSASHKAPRHQHHTELEHPLDLDLRQPPRGLAVGLFGAEHPVDALHQALQRFPVEPVGAAEAVDDARLGAPGRGVPDVLGEPVVGDGRAVPVAPLGDPQVHAQCMTV